MRLGLGVVANFVAGFASLRPSARPSSGSTPLRSTSSTLQSTRQSWEILALLTRSESHQYSEHLNTENIQKSVFWSLIFKWGPWPENLTKQSGFQITVNRRKGNVLKSGLVVWFSNTQQKQDCIQNLDKMESDLKTRPFGKMSISHELNTGPVEFSAVHCNQG